MKKNLFVLSLIPFAVSTLVGCGNKVAPGGSNTIQLKVYKGGYGVDFINATIAAFEKTFPQYHVDVVEASSLATTSAQNEILVPKKNEIDLYFVTGIDKPKVIAKSKSILRANDRTLLEPLNDILNGPAIGFNGKAETKTIKERLYAGFEEQLEYNGFVDKWHGQIYSMPWASCLSGLVFNTRVLEKYNLEVPYTTNQLLTLCQELKTKGAADNVYPYTFAGKNASGYWIYLFSTLMTQFTGKQNFDNFVKCDPGDGNIEERGYEVYKDRGYQEAIKVLFDLMDLDYCAPQTTDKDHMTAQNELVRGSAGFMVDGDWSVNEMRASYPDAVNDLQMAKTPIISSLGNEIGLTSDDQLAHVVKLIDEGKSNAEVASAYSALDEAKVQRVRNARNVVSSIGANHEIVIPSYADAKEAAKTFVKFYYSEDNCHLFRNNAYANLPVSYTPNSEDLNTPYHQSLDKIANETTKPIIVNEKAEFNDVRNNAQLFPFNYGSWVYPTTFKEIAIRKYSDRGKPEKDKLTALEIYTKEYEYAKANWETYMSYCDF